MTDKIKPVKAWGVLWPDGKLYSRTFVGVKSARYFAMSFAADIKRPLEIVRVEIRVVPKRRAKKKVSR